MKSLHPILFGAYTVFLIWQAIKRKQSVSTRLGFVIESSYAGITRRVLKMLCKKGNFDRMNWQF